MQKNYLSLAVAFLMAGQAVSSHAADSYIEDDTPTGLMVDVREAPATQEKGKDWKIDLSLGANFTSGNSDTIGANGMLSIARQIGVDLFEMKFKGSYLQSEVEEEQDGLTIAKDEVTEQNARGFTWYKKMLGERWFIYPFAEVFHDDPAYIELRTTAGGAIGYDLIKTEHALLSFDVGSAYVIEKSTEGEEDEYANVHLRMFHKYEFSETARIWEECKFIAKTDDVSDHLIEAEAGVETDISSGFSLKLVAENRYDSDPIEDVEKNDFSISAFVVFKY